MATGGYALLPANVQLLSAHDVCVRSYAFHPLQRYVVAFTSLSKHYVIKQTCNLMSSIIFLPRNPQCGLKDLSKELLGVDLTDGGATDDLQAGG